MEGLNKYTKKKTLQRIERNMSKNFKVIDIKLPKIKNKVIFTLFRCDILYNTTCFTRITIILYPMYSFT